MTNQLVLRDGLSCFLAQRLGRLLTRALLKGRGSRLQPRLQGGVSPNMPMLTRLILRTLVLGVVVGGFCLGVTQAYPPRPVPQFCGTWRDDQRTVLLRPDQSAVWISGRTRTQGRWDETWQGYSAPGERHSILVFTGGPMFLASWRVSEDGRKLTLGRRTLRRL